MTPFEIDILAQSYISRKKEDTQEKITLAYLNAKWTIQWLGKKKDHPSPLKEILDSIGKEKIVMTDEQMLERVKALNAVFGGEVKEIAKE